MVIAPGNGDVCDLLDAVVLGLLLHHVALTLDLVSQNPVFSQLVAENVICREGTLGLVEHFSHSKLCSDVSLQLFVGVHEWYVRQVQ